MNASVPDGWEVHFDDASGREFFYHAKSGRTEWEQPW